jgi:hypothetical protein
MVLISCYECDAKISDKAKSCPKCGAPLEKIISKSIEQNTNDNKEHNFKMTLCIVTFFLTLFLFTLYQDAEKEFDEAFQEQFDCYFEGRSCWGVERAIDDAEARENNLWNMMWISGIICFISLIKLWADNIPGVVVEKTTEED